MGSRRTYESRVVRIVIPSGARDRPGVTRSLAPLGMTALLLTGCAALRPVTGVVVADRPGYTDAPTALPAGGYQVEAGVTDDHVDDVTYRSAGELLLRVGLGARTELRLFGNSIGTRSVAGAPAESGLEDSKLGLKIALHTAPDSVHGLAPRLALLLATTVPTGAESRTAHKAQPEAKIAAAWTTSGPWSLYTNFGFGGVYDGTEWGTHAWTSAALWYAVSPKVSLFGEGLATGRVSGSATSSQYLDGGVTYLFGDHLQVDARYGHGVGSATSHEHFVGVGMAWRW
jgi:hypothetical protein